MDSSEPINRAALIDDAKCHELIRQHRWPDGVAAQAVAVAPSSATGVDDTQKHRQRYRCKRCGGRFDDLTGTILAGRHQPLRVWVLCLRFMGLNLSNRQIAHELGLDEDGVQAMTASLRAGLLAKAPKVKPAGAVEIDEVSVVAGHKGHPEAPHKKAARAGVAASRERAAATLWRRKNRPSSG